jgi:hypothetical protein
MRQSRHTLSSSRSSLPPHGNLRLQVSNTVLVLLLHQQHLLLEVGDALLKRANVDGKLTCHLADGLVLTHR